MAALWITSAMATAAREGSFVRDAGHVREFRQAVQDAGGHALIVSKIEDQEAVRNLDDIIIASDLIMVARGALGIEFFEFFVRCCLK